MTGPSINVQDKYDISANVDHVNSVPKFALKD